MSNVHVNSYRSLSIWLYIYYITSESTQTHLIEKLKEEKTSTLRLYIHALALFQFEPKKKKKKKKKQMHAPLNFTA